MGVIDDIVGFITGKSQASSTPAIQSAQKTVQQQQRQQVGWNQNPNGGYQPVFNTDNIKPQYTTIPQDKNTPQAVQQAQQLNAQQPQVAGVQTTANKPYYDLVKSMFPDRTDDMYQTVGGESSYNPRLIHANGGDTFPGGHDSMEAPSNFTREQWDNLRAKHPNLDVGLLQINTDAEGVMAKYLQSKGLTFYDLLDPQKNAQIASDLYYGKIPGKAPGIINWYGRPKGSK